VVLAAVSVAADDTVTALTSGLRPRTRLVAGGLRLEAPQPVPHTAVGGLQARQQASAQVSGLAGGGLAVTVPAPCALTAVTALTGRGVSVAAARPGAGT
jgi:hypothetical protein